MNQTEGTGGGEGGWSPEQQHMSPGPHSKVHQSIFREVLTPAQRTPEILEPEGELGACDPLAGERKKKCKSGEGDGKGLRRKIWKGY